MINNDYKYEEAMNLILSADNFYSCVTITQYFMKLYDFTKADRKKIMEYQLLLGNKEFGTTDDCID